MHFQINSDFVLTKDDLPSSRVLLECVSLYKINSHYITGSAEHTPNTHLKPQFLLLWFSCSLSNSSRASHFHWLSIVHCTATLNIYIYMGFLDLLINGIFRFRTSFYKPHVIPACKAEVQAQVWYLGFSCCYSLCFLIWYVKVCTFTPDTFQVTFLFKVKSDVKTKNILEPLKPRVSSHFPLISHKTQPALESFLARSFSCGANKFKQRKNNTQFL